MLSSVKHYVGGVTSPFFKLQEEGVFPSATLLITINCKKKYHSKSTREGNTAKLNAPILSLQEILRAVQGRHFQLLAAAAVLSIT